MIIKVMNHNDKRSGNECDIFGAGCDLTYLHPKQIVEVEVLENGEMDFEGAGIQKTERTAVLVNSKDKNKVFVRWVEWQHPETGEHMMLITDRSVFICNDQGDTVEALK